VEDEAREEMVVTDRKEALIKGQEMMENALA
jgi:hypothetical protein